MTNDSTKAYMASALSFSNHLKKRVYEKTNYIIHFIVCYLI